jgi:hypothetical protein
VTTASDPCADRISAVESLERMTNLRIDNLSALHDERWAAHRSEHAVLADSLATYKTDANEWRSSLSDLRGTFVSEQLWMVEHRSLMARIEVLEKMGVESRSERAALSSAFGNMRNLVLLGIAVLGALLALITFVDRGG